MNNNQFVVSNNFSEIHWLNRVYRWLVKSEKGLTEAEALKIVRSPFVIDNIGPSLVEIDDRFSIDDKNRWQALPWSSCFAEVSLDQLDMVVVDIESTGAVIGRDRIFEIGAIKMRGNREIDRFYALVNCEMHIPEFVARMTKVDLDKLKNSPTIEEVMPKFLNFVGSSVMVAHNSEFDFNFLLFEAQRLDLEAWPTLDLCTWLLAQGLLVDGVTKFGLSELATYYNFEFTNHHNAMADAAMTAKLLLKFMEMLKKLDIKTNLQLFEFEQQWFKKNYKLSNKLKKL